MAAGLKNFAHVELLLNNGSDPSTRDRAGATALHYATFVGCVDTVQTLMRHPDVHDEPDCKGEKESLANFSGFLACLVSNGRFQIGDYIHLWDLSGKNG